MKTLFVTTQTNDTHNLVDAWDSVNTEPAIRVKFNHTKPPKDRLIIAAVKKAAPELIFYIGGCGGIGLPSFETLLALRKLAPLINLIPDAADPPWHRLIKKYRDKGCFDLHVGLDGRPESPVDHLTVTPVDCSWFEGDVKKDIRCGFSGGVGGKRNTLLRSVGSLCFIRIRDAIHGDYADHVRFLKRCQIILNTAWTGSGKYYHIKGRVIEAGYAGAALLEHVNSPASYWFPESSYFRYFGGDDVKDIIRHATDSEITARASMFSRVVKEKYNPMAIYKDILSKLDMEHSFATA